MSMKPNQYVAPLRHIRHSETAKSALLGFLSFINLLAFQNLHVSTLGFTALVLTCLACSRLHAMTAHVSPMFPLRQVTDNDLETVCQTLWNWAERCTQYSQKHKCFDPSCSWSRFPRLKPYFLYYERITGSYIPESNSSGNSASIASHADLLSIIDHIQRHPNAKRSGSTASYFAEEARNHKPPTNDQHHSFNLAVRVMLMIECSVDGQTGGILEAPNMWHLDQSIVDFVASSFPSRDHPTLNETGAGHPDIREALKATMLQEIAGLRFVATDDLRNHLRLDHTCGTVEIYHFTSVLKEQLRVLREEPDSSTPGKTLALPEQLIIETLDSIQGILFPMEPESQKLLRTLVSKESFDPDCSRLVEDLPYANADIKYQYWGSRLMDLFDEMENPKPRGAFSRWLAPRSKERHVMLAALLGILTAVILGLLALIVAVFQTYIAWQAWKHPVSTGRGDSG